MVLFISDSIPTKALRVLKCFLQNTKRILIPRKEILLFLMEVFGDVKNGNEKRKGKSKAPCSSYSTDRHGLIRHEKRHDDLLFFVPFESTFPQGRKRKAHK